MSEYNYTEDGKRKELHSVDILKLKKKVIQKGLPWIILDEEKLKANFDETLIIAISEDSYES